jgi:O-succinylbenzoate synthase
VNHGIAFDEAAVFAIPMRTRFRGTQTREGVLLRGPAGWGEFCPFDDYADADCVPWLLAAVEQCTADWPRPLRASVPVNCIVPAVGPAEAIRMTVASGCSTAKVKVADRLDDFGADLNRVAAVREAMGPQGRIRVDANGMWDVDTAVRAIARLDHAADGLEYVEQPCKTVDELASVRRQVNVPIAADESIRRSTDPARVAAAGAADLAVIKAAPLGGVRRALRVAEVCGLPCVISSAVETSVGLAAELALAAALPALDFACGLGTGHLLSGDLVTEGAAIRPADGMLAVPEGRPVPDPRLVQFYGQRDRSRAQWWLHRLDRVRKLALET